MNASQTQYKICGNNSQEYSVDKNMQRKYVEIVTKVYFIRIGGNIYSAQNDSKLQLCKIG